MGMKALAEVRGAVVPTMVRHRLPPHLDQGEGLGVVGVRLWAAMNGVGNGRIIM